MGAVSVALAAVALIVAVSCRGTQTKARYRRLGHR